MAGKKRIEHLRMTMTTVTAQEVEFNRAEVHRKAKNDEETYSESVMEKLKNIEVELSKQSAILETDSSKAGKKKANEAVAALLGTEADDEEVKPKKSTFPLSLSRGSSPRRS